MDNTWMNNFFFFFFFFSAVAEHAPLNRHLARFSSGCFRRCIRARPLTTSISYICTHRVLHFNLQVQLSPKLFAI